METPETPRPLHFHGQPMCNFAPVTACGLTLDSSGKTRVSNTLPDCEKCLRYVKEFRPDLLLTRHVDTFIDSYRSDDYASFVLDYMRRPAINIARFKPWMKDHKLFCTYDGKRWRVTAASQMGDLFLASDFEREWGYDLRADVDKCSAWGPSP